MISQTTQDYQAIEQVVQNYVHGANGDVSLLQSAFLPTALINGRSIAYLYDIVARHGQTYATHRVAFIDVVGAVASMKIVVENWHGFHFMEFFHLIKTANGWKISSKSGVEFTE